MDTAHADYQAFLRAVLERPDDDLPRLLLADWLDEQHECERGEFIRLQCEIVRLARLAQDCGGGPHRHRRRFEALLLRESELLYDHGPLWCHYMFGSPVPVRPYDGGMIQFPFGRNGADQVGCTFSRGFVETVKCAWPVWERHGALIRQATPLRKVLLTTAVPREMLTAQVSNTGRLVQRHPGIEFDLPRYSEYDQANGGPQPLTGDNGS